MPSRLPARRRAEWVEGFTYHQGDADLVVRFLESVCCHTKDSPTAKAGEPMQLLDWHKHDVIEPLYGWRGPDNLRRYRLSYIEVPKKNGVLAPAA